jgi:hypothetical protein
MYLEIIGRLLLDSRCIKLFFSSANKLVNVLSRIPYNRIHAFSWFSWIILCICEIIIYHFRGESVTFNGLKL